MGRREAKIAKNNDFQKRLRGLRAVQTLQRFDSGFSGWCGWRFVSPFRTGLRSWKRRHIRMAFDYSILSAWAEIAFKLTRDTKTVASGGKLPGDN